MAYKRTRRGKAIKRRTMKRGFNIPKRATNANKMARIAQAVVRKNCETKYTRNYYTVFLRNIVKIVTTATRDLDAQFITRLALYPVVYTGAAQVNSLHRRIGNRIENVKTYNNLVLQYMNYNPAGYRWNWYHAMCRVVVFSPLDGDYDGTTGADRFFTDPLVADMTTTTDASHPMYAPLNRTQYRIYYDKVFKCKNYCGGDNGIAQNAEICVGSSTININMKPIRSVLFQTAGSQTLTDQPKYPKYNRFIAVIPYSDSDSSTTGPILRLSMIRNMYFTDS